MQALWRRWSLGKAVFNVEWAVGNGHVTKDNNRPERKVTTHWKYKDLLRIY
jgi:hypothetical protein